jgi:hypothetical protein
VLPQLVMILTFIRLVPGSNFGRDNIVNDNQIKRRIIAWKQVKGKAIPLQVLTGPEGSRRLRLPDFKTIGT